jgi:hypothetical protein
VKNEIFSHSKKKRGQSATVVTSHVEVVNSNSSLFSSVLRTANREKSEERTLYQPALGSAVFAKTQSLEIMLLRYY